MVQPFIVSKGTAIVKSDGLRCNAQRVGDEKNRTCNKLIAKVNALGQIAGSFRCDRCKQDIEISMPKL
jgi:hypothetical protein